MRPTTTLRKRLFAPLIHLAALILLLEDWFWDLGTRLVASIAARPAFQRLEARIGALPPYGALCVFMLPAIVLFPVKVLALVAIAKGHVLSGIALYLATRVGGAAAMAHIYTLTSSSLLALLWLARWHKRFMALKQRWLGALRASSGYRHSGALGEALRTRVGKLRLRIAASKSLNGRHAVRPARMLRRFAALWRARHH
ncbi:MAG: hypothetical protein Q8R69_02500 [Telluria sp.]|nr:hypothetical protein [Telluria sp.]